MKVNTPGLEKEVDLVLWTKGTSIPPDAYEPVSSLYTQIISLANEFKLGRVPREDEVADWRGRSGSFTWRTCPNLLKLHRFWLWMNATGCRNRKITM